MGTPAHAREDFAGDVPWAIVVQQTFTGEAGGLSIPTLLGEEGNPYLEQPLVWK